MTGVKNLAYKMKLDVLAADVHVCVGEEDFVNKFSDSKGLAASGRTASCHYVPAPFGCRIYILLHGNNVWEFAHEAVHAASFIQRHMGVMPHWDNDELTAYTVEHLMKGYVQRLEKAGG